MIKLLSTFFAVLMLAACSNENSYSKATDAQDAGREFIRASLDGDMKKASFFLLRDSANDYLFNKWRQQYNELSGEEKSGFRNAQIRPIRIENENDSTVNYVYSNSFKTSDTTSIKVVKVNDEWLVDLKSIH